MKTVYIATSIVLTSMSLSTQAQTVSTTAHVPFANHIASDMIEVDVYVEGEGGVWRVGPKEANAHLDSPIFATAHPVEHDPEDESKKGPYQKGQSLNLKFGEWLAAKGNSVVECEDGKGKVDADFEKLVPHGIYTMWYWTMASTKTLHLQSIEMPLGAPDGSKGTFNADSDGSAQYSVSFEPCLQGSGRRFVTGLAIAYHSDGKTYGYSPGEFGNRSHVHLFNMLPADSDL